MFLDAVTGGKGGQEQGSPGSSALVALGLCCKHSTLSFLP